MTNQTERLYHIVAIVERTGRKVYMTTTPVTHHEACVMLARFTVHKARRLQLEQV